MIEEVIESEMKLQIEEKKKGKAEDDKKKKKKAKKGDKK